MCGSCGAALCEPPIMLNATRNKQLQQQQQQICGKCFDILDGDEKTDWVRQLGYEAVAELLIFPCKYRHLHGCNYSVKWNTSGALLLNHQKVCQFRRTIAQPDISTGCQPIDHDDGPLLVPLLCQANAAITDQQQNADEVEELQAFPANTNGGPTGVHHSADYVKPSTTISSSDRMPIRHKTCTSVSSECDDSTLNHCDTIRVDNATVRSSSLRTNRLISATTMDTKKCRNTSKGCQHIHLTDIDIRNHEIDCEFNDFVCPSNGCHFHDSLTILKQHFITKHTDESSLGNCLTIRASSKDWRKILYCYDNLFDCLYYYYDTFFEILVKYIGSSKSARLYTYSVQVGRLPDGRCCYVESNRMRNGVVRAICLGWNDVSLSRGVTLNLKRNYYFDAQIQFDITITVHKVK